MIALPGGIVTFLFTDIEGSTRLIQQHPERMRGALLRHHALLRDAIGAHGGHVFHVVGDGFCTAFEDAGDAVAAALAAQRALHHESWGEVGALRVRMGLHTGPAEALDGDYGSSLTLARAERVTTAGHGGQTLLSAAAAERAGSHLPSGATLRNLGKHKLRGIAEPEPLFQLVAADLPTEFPPLRVEESRSVASTPLGDLVRGKLIGRTGELQQLTFQWDQAQQAHGQLVLLSGEPGVGKTRLAQGIIAHAQRSGATILRGGCYEYEATTPYLPFVEALREWVRWQGTDQLRSALAAAAPEIAKLAPEIDARLGPLVPNAPLSPGEERLRLFDNIARFLQSLAAKHGLLLFIDDIHWADQGTLSLLHYALRHLRQNRVLIVAAYRELELDRTHPLAAALVDWNRERLATRIALSRLSRSDTATLIASLFGQESVSEEFVAALYRETEGNPFFVEEVVKSLVEQGQIYREGDGWGRKDTQELAVPQSVKEAIGYRLTRLSEGTIDALRTAAALGKAFSFQELAAVSSAEDDMLLDALDEATAAQLIRTDGAGGADSFAFTHDKIREVLYEELNPIRRRRLHQRIGETLERIHGMVERGTDAHAQDLAYHFTQAGDFTRSLDYSRRAADNAERVFAHDEAIKFLEQARESAETLNRADDLVAVDERIGDIHEVRGVIPTAVESYERALAGATTREACAALKAKLANAWVPLGDPRGLAYLEQALVELDPRTQSNALALSTALMGRYHHYRTEHRKAIEFLQRARALAEPLADPSTLAGIYAFLAGAYQHLLEYEQSDHWARVSIAFGERERFPGAIANGNEFLSENAAGRGLWDAALKYAEADIAEGRKIGAMARVAWGNFCVAQVLREQGKLAEAREVTLATLAVCEQIGEGRLATWLEPIAATLASDLGDDEAAKMHADRSWERAEQLQQLLLSAWALDALGYSAIHRGDLSSALQWYERYVALVRHTENGVARNLIMANAADTFVRAGRLDEAQQLADQALAVANFAHAPHRRAMARRVQGQILAARGRHDDAIRAFDDAIAEFASVGSRLEGARVRLHRGASYAASGATEAARADAGEARDEFAAMGALRDRARAERLLRP